MTGMALSLIASILQHFPYIVRELQSFFNGRPKGISAFKSGTQIWVRHFRGRRKKSHTRVQIWKRRSDVRVGGIMPASVCFRGTLKVPPQKHASPKPPIKPQSTINFPLIQREYYVFLRRRHMGATGKAVQSN